MFFRANNYRLGRLSFSRTALDFWAFYGTICACPFTSPMLNQDPLSTTTAPVENHNDQTRIPPEADFYYKKGGIVRIDRWNCEIAEPMAIGGTGSQIYRAHAGDLPHPLTLKLHPENPSFAELTREAFAVWNSVRQELTAAGFADVLWSDGVHGLTEYVPGENLQDHVDALEGFTIPQIHSLMLQMADRIGKLMELEVVHGDIKPENAVAILDSPTSPPRDLRLIDFDLLRRANSSVDYIFGSPVFMSPEQINGIMRRTSDVFALGVSSLFLLANGQIKFDLYSVYRYTKTRSELAKLRTFGQTFRPDAQAVLEKALLHDKNPDITAARQLINFFLAATRHDHTARPKSGEEMRQILMSTGNLTDI